MNVSFWKQKIIEITPNNFMNKTMYFMDKNTLNSLTWFITNKIIWHINMNSDLFLSSFTFIYSVWWWKHYNLGWLVRLMTNPNPTRIKKQYTQVQLNPIFNPRHSTLTQPNLIF